jgi:group I intron endonuclease
MKSGIYRIKNTINGKVYIGQSKNLQTRKNEHFRLLVNNQHFNRKLQSSFNKYGKGFFVFEVIEECELSELNEKEIKYIEEYDSLKNGYNLVKRADVNSEMSEETKKLIGSYHKGKIISEETRKKMSQSLKGRVDSEETRRKKSEALKGKIDNNGENNPKYRKRTVEMIVDAQSGMMAKDFLEKHSCSYGFYSKIRKELGIEVSKVRKEKSTKEKKSRAGKNNAMYGKKHTEEAKNRMSISRKRENLSEETRKKMSESARKKKLKKEHKEKIKQSCVGINKKEKNPNYRERTAGMIYDAFRLLKVEDFCKKHGCSSVLYASIKKDLGLYKEKLTKPKKRTPSMIEDVKIGITSKDFVSKYNVSTKMYCNIKKMLNNNL